MTRKKEAEVQPEPEVQPELSDKMTDEQRLAYALAMKRGRKNFREEDKKKKDGPNWRKLIPSS